jgi:diaminopimelate epimerase
MTPAVSVTRNVPGLGTVIDIVSVATVSSVILSAIELGATVDAACAGAATASSAAAVIPIARNTM